MARALKRNRGNAAARYCQLATVRGDGRPACRTVVFRGFLGGPEDTAEDASRLTFVTDARSEKVGELGQQPACELCWYLPGTREQFRWARPGVDRHLATAAPPPPPPPPQLPPHKSASPRLTEVTHALGGRVGRITGRMEVIGARAAGGEVAERARQRQDMWGRLSGKARQQFLWPHPGLPRGSDDSLFSPPEPEASSPAAEDFCLLVLTPDHVDHLSLKQNKRWTHSRAGGWEERYVNP